MFEPSTCTTSPEACLLLLFWWHVLPQSQPSLRGSKATAARTYVHMAGPLRLSSSSAAPPLPALAGSLPSAVFAACVSCGAMVEASSRVSRFELDVQEPVGMLSLMLSLGVWIGTGLATFCMIDHLRTVKGPN